MIFFKRIYGVIVRPKSTLEEISENASPWQGVMILALLSLLSIFMVFNKDYLISNMGQGASSYEIDMMMKMVPFFMVFGVFSAMILTPIFHFISTGIYHLIAEFFGHNGRGKGLFSALAFASVPSMISIIITFIFNLGGMNILGLLISISIWIWTVVLKIFAIGKTYKISGLKSTFIYFIPFILGIVIVGILMLISFISLIPLIQSIGGTLDIPSL